MLECSLLLIWLQARSISSNKVPCLQGRVTLLLTLFQSLVSLDVCPLMPYHSLRSCLENRP